MPVDEAQTVVLYHHPDAYQDYLGIIWTDKECGHPLADCPLAFGPDSWLEEKELAWIRASQNATTLRRG